MGLFKASNIGAKFHISAQESVNILFSGGQPKILYEYFSMQ
jgi:hypothetical protein